MLSAQGLAGHAGLGYGGGASGSNGAAGLAGLARSRAPGGALLPPPVTDEVKGGELRRLWHMVTQVEPGKALDPPGPPTVRTLHPWLYHFPMPLSPSCQRGLPHTPTCCCGLGCRPVPGASCLPNMELFSDQALSAMCLILLNGQPACLEMHFWLEQWGKSLYGEATAGVLKVQGTISVAELKRVIGGLPLETSAVAALAPQLALLEPTDFCTLLKDLAKDNHVYRCLTAPLFTLQIPPQCMLLQLL